MIPPSSRPATIECACGGTALDTMPDVVGASLLTSYRCADCGSIFWRDEAIADEIRRLAAAIDARVPREGAKPRRCLNPPKGDHAWDTTTSTRASSFQSPEPDMNADCSPRRGFPGAKARAAHEADIRLMAHIEGWVWSPAQVRAAIRDYLAGAKARGYFSDGWQAQALRWHLERLEESASDDCLERPAA